MNEETKRRHRLEKLRRSTTIREAQMASRHEKEISDMNVKEPTFEEGPFFFATCPRLNRRYIIWSTDATTAAQLYGRFETLPRETIHVEYVGNLEDIKREYLLTPAQIADLHREGYLRL